MKIKTKSEEDAQFTCGAFRAVGIDFYHYYGRSGGSENGPTRDYWTIVGLGMKQDYRMIRDWFPDRPFIYSTSRKETVWKKSEDIV